MNIFPPTRENIKKAAEIIKSGGLVAFPTETVYGLGADALNPTAVAKIFEVKKRPHFDPLIVHIASLSQLELIVNDYGGTEQKLAKEFWPGPLTLIFNKKNIIPDIVTSGLTTVAVRMPANELARELISESGTPLAAPSANPFGRISPTKAEHVLNLGKNVDMILDGGDCKVGIESTIVKIENGIPIILRHGGLSIHEIERVSGKKITISDTNEKSGNIPDSPGQLLYHYSPRTPLVIIENDNISGLKTEKAGYLSFKKPAGETNFAKVEILSENGDIREAASRLFSCLHRLDEAGLEIIYAEKVPLQGLGIAIMDRLNRAANKK